MSIFHNWALGPAGGGVSWSSYWSTRTPSALVLTVLSTTSIKLDWTANGVEDYDGYSIERSDDYGSTYAEVDTVLVGTETFTDTPITANRAYYYRVRAYKGTEYSSYCTAVRADTIIYLEDLYTTDLTAGNVNATTSEDSGHLRTVVDTENKLSISGGFLLLNKTAAGGWGDPRLDYPLQCFHEGAVLDFVFKISDAGQIRFGFRSSTLYPEPDYIWVVGSGIYFSGLHQGVVTSGVEYNVKMIAGSDRIFTFIKGGTQYTSWTLGIITAASAVTNQFPSIVNNTATSGAVKEFKILNSDWGNFGKNYVRVNTAPWSLTSPAANGILEFSWNCQTGETLDLAFRQSDGTHRLIIRCSLAGDTIKLIKDDGGESEVVSAAYNWTARLEYRIVLKFNGTSISCSVNNVEKINTTSTFNQTATGVNVSGFTYGTNLIAYPLAYADSDFVQSAPKRQYNIWGVGDSKTAGAGDLVVNRGYLPLLCSMVNGMEVPTRIGVGGMSTATLQARIDADIAAAVGTPDYVIYNMGTNDGGTFNAAWETNTAYILDAIHTEWVNAIILCAVTWNATNGDVANAAHLVALTNVLSTRSWASIGINEKDILPNGDNGVSMTIDGYHPNRRGYMAVAEAWKTAMGV